MAGRFWGVAGRGLDPAVFLLPAGFRMAGTCQTLPSAFGRHLPWKGRLCSTTRQRLLCGDCEIGHRLRVSVLQPTQRLPCQGSWPRSGLRGSTLRRRCTFREVPAAGSRPRRVSFARGVLDGRNVANPSVCLRQTPTGCGWRIMLRALARRLHSATAALPRSGNDRSDKRRANLCIESPKRRL